MALENAFELATNPLFRELSNFITPPRAGKVTAIEGSGQVRVDTDDPDGGDVLAWPLDLFEYAVDDVVYVSFGVNSPDSAIVLGSKGSGLPTLRANWDIGEDRRILAEAMRARDSEGLRLEDDAGNLGLLIRDGGNIESGGAGTYTQGDFYVDLANKMTYVGRRSSTSGNGSGFTVQDRLGGVYFQYDPSVGSVLNMAVPGGASVGVGTTTPEGKLEIYDGTGSFLFVTKTGLAGSASTVIADGTGDVTKTVYVLGVMTNSTPTNFTVAHRIDNGGNQDYTDGGGNTLRLAVSAAGVLTATRTAGTATWAVSMLCVWQ